MTADDQRQSVNVHVGIGQLITCTNRKVS